jgi:predicted metal-dependent phosphoesterase TrpH
MSGFVDLHLHTTRSDGSMSPTELVVYAKTKGLRAIAITDHDTASGNEEGILEGKRQGVEVVPGVELSICFPHGELHMLGYFIDYESPALHTTLLELREHRKRRNPLIIQKLAKLGMPLNLQEIRRRVNNGNVGRPHIAAAMVEAGYVPTIKEAFNLYLRKDGPAYVPKEKLTAIEGLQLILQFGGLPVLAHPQTLEFGRFEDLAAFVRALKEHGLAGIEAFYQGSSEHSRRFSALADHLDLCKTGGSDFHGSFKSHIEIGTGRGTSRWPYQLVENLKTRLPQSHPFFQRESAKFRPWLHF